MRLFVFGGPRLPFGFRLGIGFDPREEFYRVFGQAGGEVEGAFLYVVEDENGYCKVGVSKDPLQRLANLQTGHPLPLRLAWCAVTPGSGYPIEALAKRTTEHLRSSGEWRRIEVRTLADIVVRSAVLVGERLLPVPVGEVPRILAIARATSGTEGTVPIYYRRPYTSFAALVLIVFTFIMTMIVTASRP